MHLRELMQLAPYQAYASGVSRLHAVVKRDAEHVMVMDLGSSNGTYLNGRRVTVPTRLGKGDSIQIGNTILEVR